MPLVRGEGGEWRSRVRSPLGRVPVARPLQTVPLVCPQAYNASVELNMLHEASCRKRVAPSLYALVRKAFGPGSSEPRSVIGACDVLDAREAAAPHP